MAYITSKVSFNFWLRGFSTISNSVRPSETDSSNCSIDFKLWMMISVTVRYDFKIVANILSYSSHSLKKRFLGQQSAMLKANHLYNKVINESMSLNSILYLCSVSVSLWASKIKINFGIESPCLKWIIWNLLRTV